MCCQLDIYTMRLALLSFFLFAYSFGFAEHAPKKSLAFHRHMFGLSVTNAMTDAFVATPNGLSPNYAYEYINHIPTGYYYCRPDYAMNVNINYSYGISKILRIEAGMGYLMQSLKSIRMALSYTDHYSHIFIPLHLTFMKRMGKGALAFSIGPDFSIPVFDSRATDNVNIPARPSYTNISYGSSYISENSSMGLGARVGYEKDLSRRFQAGIGPVCSFNNLLLFHHGADNFSMVNGRQIFHYYIGVDMVLHFGLTKQPVSHKGKKV